MSCPDNNQTQLQTKQEDECKENCTFNFKYNPNSSCILKNKRNYLEIKTDGSNKITYNNQKIVLVNVRLYTPSLHTFDGKYTDAELILRHVGANGNNIIVSVPIIAKNGISDSSIFFSKIISYIPPVVDNTNTVNVSSWSLNDVMPPSKTPFYHYSGASPYPPCNMKAIVIIFDVDYASTIKPSDLALIKKHIKETPKIPVINKQEGFIGGLKEGFIGGLKEGLITYNKSGANAENATNDTAEAMVCTEYTDEDDNSSIALNDAPAKTSKINYDWSKITSSPYFIIMIIAVIGLIGFIFFKFALPKIINKLNNSKSVMPGKVAVIPE